ncbi:hypothetical protein Fcan01_13914 [Folsomia candida]|uniref:Phospholipid scramblase n=1 Tax=Folsomia candida TaxID=158441 RepID=A0A226E333_FOLCA|nr:hypothetical protein Fcan01_13914 [Folsomia candida]
MSSFSGKKKNSVYPGNDNLLSVPNGTSHAAATPPKPKPSPNHAKLERKPSKLWTEEIQALKSCEEFFIKQTNLQTEEQTFSPSYYDIRNAKGKLTFKAIESVDPAIRDLYHSKEKGGKPPFMISIFDMKAGKEMLKINANLRQGVMLVYVKQSIEDKVIGIVRRLLPRCPLSSSTFSIERPNGADDEEANRREEMVTASFPGDITATNKALLLASLFMLDNIYFQHKRRIRERPKISRTCYIVITIVTVVILIGVLAAVFGGGGYQGNRTGGGGRRPGLG